MNIEYPIHALTGVSFPSERTPNDPNDTHYSVFDSKHGCVAHVFDERLAIKMAAAPELLEACITANLAFSRYASMHALKGTPEGDEKARENTRLAGICRDAITKAIGETP